MLLVDLELKGSTLVVRPCGELDLGVADYFRSTVEAALDREQPQNLLFNLSKLSFIDSSGLGVLLGRYRRVVKNGGKVFLVAPQPQVRRVLDLSGILRIIDEYKSESEALGANG